jgi:hypothetical protein
MAGVAFASGIRGNVTGLHVYLGTGHVYHAHTHYHDDGEAHTYWHCHAGPQEHAHDTEGDHHEEVCHHELEVPPVITPPNRASAGRDTSSDELLVSPVGGALGAYDPPPLPPPKPPPRLSDTEDHLHQLRTVVLLT